MAEYCVGTAQMGLNYGVANRTGKIPPKEIDNIVANALKNGINFFDTAQSYGDSEYLLGDALKKTSLNNKAKLITKISPVLDATDEKVIFKNLVKSRDTLKCNSLYGVLVHNFKMLSSPGIRKALDDAILNRITQNTGVSVYTPEEAKWAVSDPLVNILQLPFNIIDKRWINSGVFDICHKKQIKVFVRSIYLQGLVFMDEKSLIEKNMKWTFPYLKSLHELINKTGYKLEPLTFHLINASCPDCTIIFGVDSVKHLNSNIMHIIKSKDIDIDALKWWTNLPDFPERLLNPTLW